MASKASVGPRAAGPEPEEAPMQLLQQAQRAAPGQRAAFARGGVDECARRDKLRREETRTHEDSGPTRCSEQRMLVRRGTVVASLPAWPETPNWKATARRGKKQKRRNDTWVSEVTELL